MIVVDGMSLGAMNVAPTWTTRVNWFEPLAIVVYGTFLGEMNVAPTWGKTIRDF
jgi:hypothetical protein